MEIKVDFSDLWRQVRRVSSETTMFDWTAATRLDPIDIELLQGREISLDDLDYVNGLLSVDGRQVLLYIPDQYKTIDDVIADPSLGKRFHVADCRVLGEMRARGRFERYVVANNLSGEFKITGRTRTGSVDERNARLLVCKVCLEKLNFGGYAHDSAKRQQIWRGFSLSMFFETYSTNFKFLPKRSTDSVGLGGYTDDWKDVSSAVRERCGYICDQCSVDLSSYRYLLHVHHVNGVKADNSAANLRPLCVDCHRKQPMHDRMFISAENMTLLSSLRRAQGVYPLKGDWQEAIEMADLSVQGALLYARHLGFPAPEIGYPLVDGIGSPGGHVEVAWPQKRVGIYVREKLAADYWKFFNPDEFIEHARAASERR